MSDVYPLFREAEVISTKDPEELGRIQLKVYPELANVPEGDLPWCFPMGSGPHDGDFSTPLEKQWVYCTVWNKYWSEVSFLPFCMPDPKKPKFKDFKDKYISKVGDYKGTPDVQHTVGSILEDGFATFHDTKESQHGILHPKGTYALINKDGEVFIKSVKKPLAGAVLSVFLAYSTVCPLAGGVTAVMVILSAFFEASVGAATAAPVSVPPPPEIVMGALVLLLKPGALTVTV
jgi:hypothetical protein